MERTAPRALAAALLLAAAASCGGPPPPVLIGPAGPVEALPPTRQPYTPADVEFLTGMIHHHAQALLMAGWAESHGAGPAIRTMAERVIVSQHDEIRFMQAWLADRGEPVPEPSPRGVRHVMGGVEHDMLMPGMLTEAQLAELDAARGAAFDRLFLTYMIQHHEGALLMVYALFESPGAAQDDIVYKLASDIYADQSSEINRMQRMLDAMSQGGAGQG